MYLSKKTIIIINTLLLSLLCHESRSQGVLNHNASSATVIPNYAPATPEVAALGKFGDMPVGLSTGIADISVPIYQIKLKGITIPISLKYHSSGVKVDEFATNVGLDWVLDAGGVITQTVYGGNDLGGFPGAVPKTPQTGLLQTTFVNPVNTTQPYEPTPAYQFNKNAALGTLDTQPDIFSFSFPGGSGKFFFDQNLGIHLMPHQNLKIESPVTSALTYFIITDEKGNKFYFSDVDLNSTTTTDCSGDVTGTSTDLNKSFYLSRIITPAGEEVDFHYGFKGFSIQNQILESRYWTSSSPMPGSNYCDVLPNCITTSHSEGSGIRLTEIDNLTSGEKVIFDYSAANRLDFPGSNALDDIKINNSNGVTIRQFNLTHDYFATTTLSPTPADNYRLKLTAVQELGKAPYTFEYNPTPLPYRLSFAQDFWGYSNGAGNNTTLLPNEHSPYFDTGADRNPDAQYTAAGILTKITYPTGGSSVFDYENNLVYTDKTVGQYADYTAGGTALPDQTRTITFTVAENSMDFRAEWNSNAESTSEDAVFNPNGDITQIVLSGPSSVYFNGSLAFTAHSHGIERLLGSSQDQPVLSPGTYTITITNSNPAGIPPAEFIRLYWKSYTITHIQDNQIAGGLRVKSITDYPVSGVAKKHYYEYTDKNDPAKSSGIELNPVAFTYDYQHLHWVDAGSYYMICQYIAQNSTPQCPLGAMGGQNVIYGNVNVYDNDKHNGYTAHEFMTNFRDNLRFSEPALPSFPFVPKSNLDWLQGLPVKTTTYKYIASNNNYVPLQINEKLYKTRIGADGIDFYDSDPANMNEFYVRGAKIVFIAPMFNADNQVQGAEGLASPQFAIGYYYLYSSWYHLDQEINTNYDQNGQSPVVNTTNYYYDNPSHIQLTRTVTTNSNGKVITAVNTYPDDYTAGTTFIDHMKSNHQVAYPIEQVRYQDDANGTKITGGQITQYQAGDKALVDKLYSWEAPNPVQLSSFKFSDRSTGQLPYGTANAAYGFDPNYKERITYNLYDNVGNPLTVSQTSGSSVSYAWGYAKQYAVAECKNASNDEFFTETFEEASSVQTTGGHTGHNYYSGSYTTSDKLVPNYHGKSYMLSYWYTNESGAWTYSGELTYAGQALSGNIDDVRIYPKDAQVTTYTYDPLVGMTSATDAKGQTTYYEYDSFQRLMNIKDKDGKILKHMDYHYANQ